MAVCLNRSWCVEAHPYLLLSTFHNKPPSYLWNLTESYCWHLSIHCFLSHSHDSIAHLTDCDGWWAVDITDFLILRQGNKACVVPPDQQHHLDLPRSSRLHRQVHWHQRSDSSLGTHLVHECSPVQTTTMACKRNCDDCYVVNCRLQRRLSNLARTARKKFYNRGEVGQELIFE